MSPGAIKKAARTNWRQLPKRMAWHTASEFQKTFKYYEGQMHLIANEILEGLNFQPTHYAPILQTNQYGNFRYQEVVEGNPKCLKKTKNGEPKDDN